MQRALFSLLAINAPRVVSVDRLIDQLWGDQPPGAAAATLQAYISQLRKILEPDRQPRSPSTVLVTIDPGYALRVDPQDVDLFRFAELCRRGHDALAAGDIEQADAVLSEAMTVCRGNALAEFADEPWAAGVASRVREGVAVAVEDRMDVFLAQGLHTAIVGDIESLVDSEPLRERRWAQLMLALYRAGRQADALRAYQRCRRVLGEDLGIEPGATVRRLERAIFDQDPSLDWEQPVSLVATSDRADARRGHALATVVDDSGGRPDDGPRPGSHRPLIARAVLEGRIAERLDALADYGGAIVLVGEPGIGKTTLAETALRLADERGHRTAWARCPDDGAAPAYWPWTQLLRGMSSEGNPEVDDALQHLGGGTQSIAGDQRTAQFELYQLMLAALASISRSAPAVLVIDDLHAADAPSQSLLSMLGADLHRMHVLLVITARDPEGSPQTDQLLGDLTRYRGIERLYVPGFTFEEVRQAAASSIGELPSAELAAEVHDRTGGNPFFVTELVRLLASEHRGSLATEAVTRLDVPANVRDVLARRIGRLPADTRGLLTLGSVIGRTIDLELLAGRLEARPGAVDARSGSGGRGGPARRGHPVVGVPLSPRPRPGVRLRGLESCRPSTSPRSCRRSDRGPGRR